MKWFKHMSDALDDIFVQELVLKYGGNGYMVYFGIIEIIAKENGSNLTGKLEISPSLLKQKFHISQTKLGEMFEFCSGKGKLFFNKTFQNWKFEMPKMLDLKDNYTKDLQVACKQPSNHIRGRSRDKINPPISPLKGESVKAKKKTGTETYSEDFEIFWKTYPHRDNRPLGKDESRIRFSKLPAAAVADFLAATKNYADSKPALGIKNPAGWILSGKGSDKHEPWREWVNPPAPSKPKSEFTEDHHARAKAAYEKKFGGLIVVGK